MMSTSLSLMMSFIVLTTTLSTAAEIFTHRHHLLPDDYSIEVCSPNTTSSPSSSPITPPCVAVIVIETNCARYTNIAPTSPDEWTDYAECMCTGSYFQDWHGCQDCLYYHGLRTEREEAFYLSVMSIASISLCGFLSTSSATMPTADFASLFSAAVVTATLPTTGATVSSDRAPSQTAVSLYLTANGTQGPGSIGGTINGTSVGGRSSVSSTKTLETISARRSSGSAAATSSSGSGSDATRAPGNLLLGLAGAAMAVAL